MEDRTLDFDGDGGDDLARLASLGEVTTSKPVIAGYQLDEVLGEGSFGEVWSGTQLSTGQRVAIKALQRTDLGSVAYLQNEVTRLANLGEHPNVLSLIDANLQNTPAFLVTPLLQGSLEAHVNGQVSIAQVTDWMEEVAQALVYIHGRGMLHCDLKPSNLLLDKQNHVRVVDFGQAHLLEEAGVSLGTLWFMPPEQIPTSEYRPIPEVSWDLYAWGATTYSLLTGRTPRHTPEGQASIRSQTEPGKQLEQYRRMLRENPLAPVRSYNPRVDRDLAAIVERALELSAETRYHSAGEILAELSRRRRRVPVKARPPSVAYVGRRFLARNWLLCALFFGGTTALAWTGAQLHYHRAQEVLRHSQAEAALGLRLAEQGSLRGLLSLARAIEIDPKNLAARLHFSALRDCHLEDRLQVIGPGRQGAVSGDGTLLFLTDHRPNMVMGYSSADGSEKRSFDFGAVLARFQQSRDGRWLIGLGQKGEVAVMDLRVDPDSFKKLPDLTLALPSPVLCVDVAIGGSLVVGCKDGQVVWRSADGKNQRWKHQGPVASVLLSADGLWAASAGRDGVVELHGLDSSKPLRSWTVPAPVIGMCWAKKAQHFVVACEGGRLSELSPDGSEKVWHQGASLRGITQGPGGQVLAWGGKSCWVFQADGTLDVELVGSAPVTCAALSPDSALVVTGHAEGTVQLWDALSGDQAALPLCRQAQLSEVGFLPGGKELFLVTSALETWSFDEVVPPPRAMATGPASDTVWDPAGRWLATANQGVVTLWSPEGSKLALPIKTDYYHVRLMVTPLGTLIVCGFGGPAGNCLEGWSVSEEGPKRVARKPMGLQVGASPSASWLCSWSQRDPEVQLFSLDSAADSTTVQVAQSGGKVLSATPSDDGKLVAAVVNEPGGISLTLTEPRGTPLAIKVPAPPLSLHLVPEGVFYGTATECTFYDRALKPVWTRKYPGRGEVAGITNYDPPEWRAYTFDRSGRSVVALGIDQAVWMDLQSGRVLRHIWDGRTATGSLSDDGAWLCLVGGQGASLYRQDLSTRVPLSQPYSYQGASFSPDGHALALLQGKETSLFPLTLDESSPAELFSQQARARCGRVLENNQLYRQADSARNRMRRLDAKQ